MRGLQAQPLMHEPVFAMAERRPADVAIEADGHCWTYGDLVRQVRGLTVLLREKGVRPGDVVAISGSRSPQLVTAILAMSALRAVFVVLDPLQPRQRLAHIQAVVGASTVLDVHGTPRTGRRGTGEDESVSVTAVPRRPGAFGGGSAAVSDVLGVRGGARAADPDAYVAFTSGTTSVRGVVGSHAPVSNYLRWSIATFGHGRSSRFALMAGLSHDPLLRDILTPLWCGGRLTVPQPATWADPERLVRWLRASAVSGIHITPRVGRAIAGVAGPGELACLRHALFGGDVLLWDDVRAFMRIAPSARLINCYGATETPQVAACYPVAGQAGPPAADDAAVPIGWPIEGWELELSAAGEIIAQSAYLSRGYHNDPEETRRRYSRGSDGRVRYRTGDLGARLPDGSIAFLGRADRQVKVGGMRVEPAELEAHLRTHPQIADAAVVPAVRCRGEYRPLSSAGHRGHDLVLAAYVVPAAGASPLPGGREVRTFLAKRVPVAAVPVAVRNIPGIPLTPNGKLDVAALLPVKEKQ